MALDLLSSKEFERKLKKQYDERQSSYEKLVDEVLYTLNAALEKQKIKVHSVSSRETKIKSFASFYEKVKRKEIRENQFEIIDDIAGVRVICLYRSVLKRIGEVISSYFTVVKSDTTRTRTETPFGYASDHYTVKLHKRCHGIRYDDIKDLPCEIQVRTILMDAWASVAHHLEYKQEVDIPSDLRTDFNALAGLFYVADSHFEMFRRGVEDARRILTQALEKGIFNLEQEVNLDSLLVYSRWKFPNRGVPQRLAPFVVSEMVEVGYKKLSQIDLKVNAAAQVLEDFEKTMFTRGKAKRKFNCVMAVIASLDLTDKRYYDNRKKTRGWSKVILKTIDEFRARISKKSEGKRSARSRSAQLREPSTSTK